MLQALILALAHLGPLPLAGVAVAVEILITQQLVVLAVAAQAQTDNQEKPELLDKAMLVVLLAVQQRVLARAVVVLAQWAQMALAATVALAA